MSMPHRRTRRPPIDEYKRLAAERIERLFELADRVFRKRPELADRYVQLAWRLATRYNVRFPPHLKRKFCRRCKTFWVPSVTCRVRTRPHPPSVIVTCLRCGRITRLPYKQKRVKQFKRNENVIKRGAEG
jgi:ribonuclease P protein subunit RPR2